MYQNRRRQPSMGLMLLFYQLFGVIGIENIPPVTLSCIGLQVAIFLRLFKLPWRDASDVCISVYNVWKKKEYIRLLYGTLEHGDDMHLYYNMFSFAIKGQSLEKKYGSVKFLYILTWFTVLSSAVLVILNTYACKYLGYDSRECAVGFSGVIFALKVLTTYYSNNYTHSIMGLPVIMPARYAAWAELVLIQLFVPNASFFGHLAGILVGTAYVTGPLKFLMDGIYSSLTKRLPFGSSRPRFSPHTERSGYRNENYHNFVPPGMTEEEQLRRAMEESMRDSNPFYSAPPYSNSHTSSSSPPPPGFIFGESFGQPSSPPPPGFSPDFEGLFNRKHEQYSA